MSWFELGCFRIANDPSAPIRSSLTDLIDPALGALVEDRARLLDEPALAGHLHVDREGAQQLRHVRARAQPLERPGRGVREPGGQVELVVDLDGVASALLGEHGGVDPAPADRPGDQVEAVLDLTDRVVHRPGVVLPARGLAATRDALDLAVLAAVDPLRRGGDDLGLRLGRQVLKLDRLTVAPKDAHRRSSAMPTASDAASA
jgi:hypothetical protein